MNGSYSLQFAGEGDIDPWMAMVDIVKDHFPGLDTDELLAGYRETVLKNMRRSTALCVKYSADIVGLLLFSYRQQCLSCMAVHPQHRRQGIASAMIEKMITLFPADADITVTTFREGDPKGTAPRALYRKYGFEEGELAEEHGYPNQRFVLRRG